MKIPSYICTMKKFKTREALLQDSIDYYWGKPERRCVVDGRVLETCQYSPSETSMGCAIGRLVPKKLAKKLDKTNDTVDKNVVFDSLPKWLQDLGQDFLVDLQFLHDGGIFKFCHKDVITSRMKGYVDMDKITFPENN